MVHIASASYSKVNIISDYAYRNVATAIVCDLRFLRILSYGFNSLCEARNLATREVFPMGEGAGCGGLCSVSMQFESLYEALLMDGHGFYVWLAVGTSVVIMIAMVLIPIWSHKQFMSNLKMHASGLVSTKQQGKSE